MNTETLSGPINLGDMDPCAKELDMSMKCLFVSGHDSIQCKDYVKNYDNCRNFWTWIQSVRNKEGIEPAMPPSDQWEQIKDKYLPLIKPPEK